MYRKKGDCSWGRNCGNGQEHRICRTVNKDDVIILDSMNYIKGYRYELFCLIKHAQTPHCLVYCLTSPEISAQWNASRGPEERYAQEILDALVMRFEAPDSRNRWDSPLFTVQHDDSLPFEAISDAIFHRKAPPPNQSTQSQPLSSTNFLHELDKVTQDILTAILNAQKTSVPGDVIAVPAASEKISFWVCGCIQLTCLFRAISPVAGRVVLPDSKLYPHGVCGWQFHL
ncbi:protein KTI12 homolog isoform X1 [Paramormyrops kingsleyae]|uniref:protein KTI12 homolog isoform X1 n=1 Tax=Paramormyrops kingsleyae TaxID=1676925 RepID=UPI003B97B4E9